MSLRSSLAGFRSLRVLASILIAGLGFSTATALAERATSATSPVELLMDQVPLDEVVEAIAERTGNDYIFESPLPGRVTVAVPSRVSAAEATEILNAVLVLKGLTALPLAPNTFKIVRWEQMAGSAPLAEAPLDTEAERSVTTRIALRHADPQAVATTLRPMLQSGGQVVAFPPAGSLIFAGTENRVQRLIGIARELDAAAQESLGVRRIRYRDASEVKEQLDVLLAGASDGSAPASEVHVRLDPRTNSLLLSAPPTDLERLGRWIDRLDTPAAGSGGVHVVRLMHHDPEGLSQLLNAQARVEAAGGGDEQAAVDTGPLVGRDFSIVAHRPTRSLLIRSDRTTFEALRELISELDREPRMVRVDVEIFEIATDGALGLGVGGAIPVIKPKVLTDLALGFAVNPELLALDSPFLRIEGEEIESDLIPPLGVAVLAQETRAEIKILQRPSITLALGEESELFVGSNVPIPVGSTTPTLTGIGPSISVKIEREDIGTRFRLKPAYNRDGLLRLDLEIENQAVHSTGDPELGPTVANRSIDTSFLAGVGKRMVLARLNSETATTTEARVPFLSDIPVLGRLFTAKAETTRRTYWVVAVRAQLVPTTEERMATSEALARAVERIDPGLDVQDDSRYAVRVASYYKRQHAEAARDSLELSSRPTLISRRDSDNGARFDLFVLGLQRICDVAKIALELEKAGLRPEIVPLVGGHRTVR